MSSKRRIRRKACGQKAKYTEAEAAEHARHARRGTGEWIVAYACTYCSGWHLGHPNRRQRQALVARRGR